MPRLRAAYRPANPPPTTITRWGGRVATSVVAMMARVYPADTGCSNTGCGRLVWLVSSGKRRATTRTPRTHRTPPETTANCGAGQGGDDRRLDVAEPRAAGHDEGMDRRDPAAQLIGRVELDERRAEDGRKDVGGAGDGEEEEGQRERDGHEPERGDRQTPHGDRGEDRPARSVDARDPAREQGAEERPGGRRGRDQAEADRPDAEDVQGEDREERRRHPEDHRVEVDGEGAQDDPAAAANRRPSRIASGRAGRRRRAAGTARSREGHEATPRTRPGPPRRRRRARPSR